MTAAWETSLDDLDIVLSRHSLACDEDQLRELFEHLDHATIERAAAASDDYEADLEKQTAAVFSEIEDQLLRAGIISEPKKFKGGSHASTNPTRGAGRQSPGGHRRRRSARPGQ